MILKDKVVKDIIKHLAINFLKKVIEAKTINDDITMNW
jgi:uncharacterized membrane protein YqhA